MTMKRWVGTDIWKVSHNILVLYCTSYFDIQHEQCKKDAIMNWEQWIVSWTEKEMHWFPSIQYTSMHQSFCNPSVERTGERAGRQSNNHEWWFEWDERFIYYPNTTTVFHMKQPQTIKPNQIIIIHSNSWVTVTLNELTFDSSQTLWPEKWFIYNWPETSFVWWGSIIILDWLYVLTTLSVCLYQLFQQWGSTQQTSMSESIYCNRNIFRVKKLQIHSTVLCTFCIAVCLVCSAYQKGKKLNKGGETHFHQGKWSTVRYSRVRKSTRNVV